MSANWDDPCPACKAPTGQPCRVPIPGVDTAGWQHDARVLLPLLRDLRTNRPIAAAEVEAVRGL